MSNLDSSNNFITTLLTSSASLKVIFFLSELGSKIKNIREDSQIELAKIFNKKVHLYLKVLIDK